VFDDYRTDHFVHSGVTCLVTGLLHAAAGGLARLVVVAAGGTRWWFQQVAPWAQCSDGRCATDR